MAVCKSPARTRKHSTERAVPLRLRGAAIVAPPPRLYGRLIEISNLDLRVARVDRRRRWLVVLRRSAATNGALLASSTVRTHPWPTLAADLLLAPLPAQGEARNTRSHSPLRTVSADQPTNRHGPPSFAEESGDNSFCLGLIAVGFGLTWAFLRPMRHLGSGRC
jgi:hypothetical protein